MEETKEFTFKFTHGLGDCALFAHAVPLWTSRGYRIGVQCSADKACLFQAAGAEVVESAPQDHRYLHAPTSRVPELHEDWQGSKCGWNMTQKPMPGIGTAEELWPELLATKLRLNSFLSPESKDEIDGFVNKLSGPLILLHTRGNSGSANKSVPELEQPLYRELIERTDATILSLDWDDRCDKIPHSRFLHLGRDWRNLSVPELAYLIERAALLIGIDSGPLHLTRFTDTPALGLWTNNTVSHFALPRDRTAHIAASGQAAWTRAKRHSFHIIDGGRKLSAEFVAKQAVRMMELKSGRELVLADLLDRCSVSGPHTARDNTFRLVLDYLRTRDCPQIIETGCIRSEEDFTAGFSTYLFGLFLDSHGGKLDSVDIDERNVNFARYWTSQLAGVNVHQGDSVNFLESCTGPKADVIYLDSLDVGQPGYAEHCWREAQAAEKIVEPGGLILIDDTWREGETWKGKGTVAVPYLLDRGYQLVHSGYATLLKSPREATT